MVEDLPFDPGTPIRSFIRLRQRRKVVFPQPEGPISAVISLRRDRQRHVADGAERRRSTRDTPWTSKTVSRSTPSASVAAPGGERRAAAPPPRRSLRRASSRSHPSPHHFRSYRFLREIAARFTMQDHDQEDHDGGRRQLPPFVAGLRAQAKIIVGSAVYGPWSVSSDSPPRGRRNPVTAPTRSSGAVSPNARASDEDRAGEHPRAPRTAARGCARPPTASPRRRRPPPGCSRAPPAAPPS